MAPFVPGGAFLPAAPPATPENAGRRPEEEYLRSPSVQYDLNAGVPLAEASRAQRFRSQLRTLDAELAILRAEVTRSSVLRGPSGKRFVCDEDIMVGGCEKEFNEEEGVLCDGCKLFLCDACFGAILVSNECQQGGRYDLGIGDERALTGSSPAGSLPCPLFPQDCNCGHIPLVQIGRALLHKENRGRDGDREDLHSVGHSPHKLHLISRQRIARSQLPVDADESFFDGFENTLIRTIADFVGPSVVQMGADLARTTRAALAEKQDEVDQLKEQLKLQPPAEAIPDGKKRVCAQCHEEFALFEGGQCYFFRNSHFLCMTCFGGYLMKACGPGGCYEKEITVCFMLNVMILQFK